MSNIFAAIGREQLKKINSIEKKRKEIVNYYLENLKYSSNQNFGL